MGEAAGTTERRPHIGDAATALALALLVAGIACLAWWGIDGQRVSSLTATFSEADADDGHPIAIFKHPANSAAGTVAFDLLGVFPAKVGDGHDHLRVTIGAVDAWVDLIEGADVPIEGERFRVARVRTWQGLLPVTDGAAMVSISLLRPPSEPVENLLLAGGQRVQVDETVSIEVRQAADRGEALAMARERRSVSGRWGVVDETGVLWFDSFVAGTGATLADGSVVSLESFAPDSQTVIVRRRKGDLDEVLRADGPSNSPPLLFQPPVASNAPVAVYVFEDNRALISGAGEPADVGVEEVWDAPGGLYALRLEQALLSAAPVLAAESPFFEAVLESAQRRVRVRQGEAVRVGNALLRYAREPRNETAAMQIRVSPDEAPPIETILTPGQRAEFAWAGAKWFIAHRDVHPGDGVTIRRVRPARFAGAFGMSAILAAAILILGARARRAD